MGYLLKIHIGDDETVLTFFKLFSIGFMNPLFEDKLIRGLMIGIWKFQIQLTLAYDRGVYKLGGSYEA